ncbi:MAG: hypothetical protein ACXVJ7_02675 [Acidimicrobiia bacterium]
MRRFALLAAIALALTACYRPAAVHMQETNPEMRPWWCHSEQMPDEPGAQWYVDHGIHKGDLSWEDCITVSGYLDDALAYAMQWPTRGQAEAAGWHAQANYAAGMGTHHALGSPLSSTFDPKHPTFLQYGGNTADAKLVGVSWYVYNGPDGPPAGFPGDNDWWHRHEKLCLSNQTGVVIFDGPCPPGTDGNTVDLSGYWLLHAWIVPGWQHLPDVFVGHHPCLLASGPAAPDDTCWTDAMQMG